jgi:FkbM family methyltransferase
MFRLANHYTLRLIRNKVVTDSYGFKYTIEASNSLDFAIGVKNSKEVEYIHYVIGLCKKPSRDIAIDVGANKGYFSLPLSMYFKVVVAYEPVSSIFNQLKSNINLNNIDNIKAVNRAISDKSGSATMYIQSSLDNDSKINTGLSSLIERKEYLDSKQEVVTENLDSHFEKADFIKIDCEGNEYKVLLGASRLILNTKPDILWEANTIISRENTLNCFQFFEDIGWISYAVLDSQSILRLFNISQLLELNQNLNIFSTSQRIGDIGA